MTEATIDAAAGAVRVRWTDGAQADFPFMWLRDNCPTAFHPETEERVFDLMTAPDALVPETVEARDGAIRVVWAHDGHVSAFDPDWLRARRPGRRVEDAADVAPLLWDRDTLPAADIPRAEAAALLADDRTLLDWLRAARRTGLGLVTDLAAGDAEAGQRIARRVGFLRETNFGVTFDVMSKPNPNNLAYTAGRLTLHTDLPNQELAPGFQFLHCIENTARGGGSLFADGFRLAAELRAQDPEAFALLRDTAIPFRFHDADADIRKRDTVIRVDHDGEVTELRFSGHLTDTFDLPADTLPAYYRAYRRFMALTRDERFILTTRLESGQMAVFDNRRILHGRDAFDPQSGERRLRGCYVDRGEWDSRIRVLARSA